MATKSVDIYAGISSDAVKAKTSKGWAEWFAVLDKAGAAKWKHKEIADYLRECDCGPWWSQMVTVGYEQARGLRVKHQTADGFTAGASKTVDVPVDELYTAWTSAKSRAKWLPDAAGITIHERTANKSLRVTWIDGSSKIDVQFYSKGSAKSQVTIERRKLGSVKEVRLVKAYWSAALGRLKELLEASSSAKAPAKRRVAIDS